MEKKNKLELLKKPVIKNNSNVIRLLCILVLVYAIMAILQPEFFPTKGNFVSMCMQFPEYGLMALGCSLAMVAGGIDLSLVSTANLTAIIIGTFLSKVTAEDASEGTLVLFVLVSYVLAIIVGAVCGVFNGFLIGKIKVPAMLATLGTQSLFAGIGLVITKGKAVTGFPYKVVEMGTKKFAGLIPVPLLIFAVCCVVVWYIMERSTFGVRLCMLGTNPKASELTGQNNLSILIRTHMLGGILAALAGMIMLSRMNSARADYGSSYTMQAILISVLGGTNPSGGFGSIMGVTVAVLILQTFASGLNMFTSLNAYFKEFAWGVVLILVITLNYLSEKKNKKG